MPTTVYNTIVVPTFSFDNANSALGTTAGNSFSTLATTTSLNRVGIYIFRSIPANNGTVKVSLFANDPTFIQPVGSFGAPNGIWPGALLTDLGSISDTAMTAGYQTFYFPSNYPLSPSTRYWIMFTDISIPGQFSGLGLGWIDYATQVASAVGVVGEYYVTGNSFPPGNGGTVPNDIQGPYQIQVDVDP